MFMIHVLSEGTCTLMAPVAGTARSNPWGDLDDEFILRVWHCFGLESEAVVFILTRNLVLVRAEEKSFRGKCASEGDACAAIRCTRGQVASVSRQGRDYPHGSLQIAPEIFPVPVKHQNRWFSRAIRWAKRCQTLGARMCTLHPA